MFDGICILLALFLYSKAEEGYRNIAFFVLCWFVVSDAVYHYFFLDIRGEEGNGWIIYQLYNLINVLIILKIRKLMSPLFIIAVLTVNVLLNIVASFYFISNLLPESVYNVYPYVAGFIMLLSLFYLWTVSYGIRLADSKGSNTNIISAILRLCIGKRYRVRIQRFKG